MKNLKLLNDLWNKKRIKSMPQLKPMRQYLPNGAMLEFSKNDSSGDVFFKGLKVKHFDVVMLNDIESIQNWAMTLR